jgi:hypothetical protein
MSMKNSEDTIGNRTRDLPDCSAKSQPTASPRVFFLISNFKPGFGIYATLWRLYAYNFNCQLIENTHTLHDNDNFWVTITKNRMEKINHVTTRKTSSEFRNTCLGISERSGLLARDFVPLLKCLPTFRSDFVFKKRELYHRRPKFLK